jgi:zeta-carotene desaturase
MKDAELVELAMKELRERSPAAQDLQVLHSKATREMAATFRWTLQTGSLRPGPVTPFPNVFLAGDWTDTGLPATIEGACLSGHHASQKAMEFLKAR